MAERGKAFLLVITPSKAEVYPEYLPDEAIELRNAYQERKFSDELRDQLKTQGVNFVDAPEIMRQRKPTSELLFSRIGTHWNYLGCFYVWNEALKNINQQFGSANALPRLASLEYDMPRGTDSDIGMMANRLTIPGGIPIIAYPVVEVNPIPFERRPTFLFVGTSFTWAMVSTAYLVKSTKQCDVLYYYSSLYRCDEVDPTVRSGQLVPRLKICSVNSEEFDLSRVLLDKDVVVLECHETADLEFDFGFCEDALTVLRQDAKCPMAR